MNWKIVGRAAFTCSGDHGRGGVNTQKVGPVVFGLGVAAVLVLLSQQQALAFELGIPELDGFLQSIEDGIPRCGLLMALIGGAAVTLAKFENHFNSFFSGYFNYFVTAGMFGGLVTILGTIGVVG